MIHGKNFDFDQPVQSSVRRYDNIRKIATGQQSMGSTDFEFPEKRPKTLTHIGISKSTFI